MTDTFPIRQSTIEGFLDCPRRTQYELVYPRRDGLESMMGTAYHAALEMYYTDRINDPSHVYPDDQWIRTYLEHGLAVFKEISQGWTSLEFDEPLSEAQALEVDELIGGMILEYFHGRHQWGPEVTIGGAEVTFRYDAETSGIGIPVQGTTDLILHVPGIGIVIDDHKSSKDFKRWADSKTTGRHKIQACMYLHYFRAWLQIPEDMPMSFTFSVMTRVGTKASRHKDRKSVV